MGAGVPRRSCGDGQRQRRVPGSEHFTPRRLPGALVDGAVEGYDEPIFYHGEPTGHVIRRYSDGPLALLLKGLKPERYGDNVRLSVNVSGVGGRA